MPAPCVSTCVWVFNSPEVASLGRENIHVMVVVSLMEAEWSSYGGGQFKGWENGYATEAAFLMEGEWSLQK